MTRIETLELCNSIVVRAVGGAEVSAPTRARMVHTLFGVLYHEAPSADLAELVAEYAPPGDGLFAFAAAVTRLAYPEAGRV